MKVLNGVLNIYLLTKCFLTVIHSDPADNNICDRISLAKSILRREEHLLEIVSFLASSFNERVSKLRTCMPKRTITDLPDELIVLIFDLSEPNLRDLRHLLLISKKCRQIALSSPCLWARQTMSPKLSPYAIDAIARRSRGLGLQASFISFPGPNQTMLRDCERWSDLALRRFTEFDLMRFKASVPCTRLAGIEKMSITGSNDSLMLLDSSWSLPFLKTLKCVQVMPFGIRLSVMSECSLQFSNYLSIDRLALCLAACPSLEMLTITLRSVEDGGDGDTPLETSLSALKHFALISDDVETGVVEVLFRTLLFPNITSFRAQCFSGQIHDDTAAVECFWALLCGMKSRYPDLKKALFHVGCGEGNDEHFVFILHDILEELPDSLQDLTLTFEDIYLRAYDGLIPDVVPCGRLRTIVFDNCNHLVPKFFYDFDSLIKKYGIKLDDVGIINCFEYDDEEQSSSEFDDADLVDNVIDEEESSHSESDEEESSHSEYDNEESYWSDLYNY